MAHVLIVDDEKSIRLTLRAFLADAGHEVQLAEDVDSALALLGRTEIDVVVTDIILPRRTGMDLLRALRDAASRIPVIVMTGEPSLETATLAVRARVSDYLGKPITKDAIVSSVTKALTEKARDDEHARLQAENEQYRRELERLVSERTHELQASEKRFRILVENAPDSFLLCDISGRILDVNHRACEMHAYSRDELLELSISDVVRGIPEPQGRDCKDRLEAGDTYVAECFHRRKDGRLCPAEAHGALFESDGRTMLLALVRDISERRQSQRMLHTILRAAPVGIGLVVERVLQWGNERLSTMTGYACEEFVGMDARRLYPTTEEYERVGREKYAQIQARGWGSIETQLKRKDGVLVSLLLSSAAIDPEDLSAGVVFTALEHTGEGNGGSR